MIHLFHLGWFTSSWWGWLLSPTRIRGERWARLRSFVCRLRGHAGPIWHSPDGSEPDMRCRECRDDMG